MLRNSGWLGLSLAIALGLGSIPSRVVSQETPLTHPQIQSFFSNPPRLIKAESTFKRTLSRNAVYYFLLTVPENAGTGLQRVEIAQESGESFMRLIQFDTSESEAFVGTPGNRGADLPLGETTYDRDNQSVTVVFDPPVAPGTAVTIALTPERNPRQSGVYLFGVTAYPTGATESGQFLGYGRLTFYDSSDATVL